ncbi:TPA: TolC family protein [Stenotrophomonas maltophilia]|nr:TolC family protein [Stenotrophomonas maltophilia]HDS1024517.1 TolC family protein [Stenotrophomonas maltophilia]HDS1029249.1 TolC family protein [Stenotrophomonas maltophilia]HDS1033882.1 TolC family protein [Stenotrophomonas maltophilia]
MSILTPRSPRAAGLVVAVLLGLAPAQPAMAQAAPSYDTLLERLDQLPGTRVGAALAEAADARAEQARALPNPSLSYTTENAWGTGSYGGMGRADTVLTLSQPLEVWGQRAARVRAAHAEAQAANLRGALSRSDVASQLATFYAQAESALRRYTLAEEALALTRDDATAVDAMVRQGREPQLRAVQARSEVANATAALEEAQAFRDAALARLAGAALLDAPVQSISSSLLDRTPPLPRGAREAALGVRIAEAEADAAGRLVEVERKRALPDLSVTAAQTRFREDREQAYTLGVSLSIPLFDRNRGGIRAASAEQRAAEARLDQQRRDSDAERLSAVAGLKAAGSRTRAADDSVVAAEEAYRLARIGFDAGRISQLELRSTRSALIAARGTAVDARVSRVAAEIDLARLEGRAPFVEVR